ncbi:methionine--tRNA ligase [Microlunatus sp. Gsoil 973]|uniref:methionine--tRNA ligase n=1 Tax=Microlunatus sp. Gsoil 973 TaxID=2672569 RepID=UPI0012B4C92A|nr:methionine--tRNA ligase [Microlunatus sp. Gsoil 973]QGN32761.1 methionine--tRNA ligase [Microlunatus sp. Gsoil 973]
MISYFTTSIPYVNARPHLGHALEFVQTDVLARHRRLRGDQVRFLTGTDDNALKNVTAAREAGLPVAEFVRANGDAFVGLADALAISCDDVIRTGSDPRHRRGVAALWDRIRGDLYRRSYTGRYCAGCEQFYSEAELLDGRCPEHGTVPEMVTEQNWFFRLSSYQQRIEDAITSGRVDIQPEHRRAEVLSFIRSGLEDFSVSRAAERTGGWGISVPGDPSQTIYVWWDALANYITALGYPDQPAYQRWWAGSDHRTHVIGKGISRFHAIYWLGTLLAAGEPLPSRIVVHEYLQLAGRKISKSDADARVETPATVLDRYGRDALRWWLVSDVNRVGDTDFSEERLRRRYIEDLANTIGNLVNRVVVITGRHFPDGIGAAAGPVPELEAVRGLSAGLPSVVDDELDRFDLRRATGAIVDVAAAANQAIEAIRPWELARSERAADRERLATSCRQLVDACRTIATELAPFIPDGATRLGTALGSGDLVGEPIPAFPRLPVSDDTPHE